MNLKINFNEQNSRTHENLINSAINYISSRMILPEGELSISFVNQNEIKELNKQYRNKDFPTDVLTFPMFEDEILGDIYICIEEANKKADEYKINRTEQLVMTIAHAFAHLQGYNHENEEERKVMEDYEDFLLKYYDEY